MTDPSSLSAHEAAQLLGIKRATLYTYVSRGLVRTVPDPASSRRRRYVLADLRHLKARHDARAGHGPVAAAALDWGEPVVDSAITRIDARRGPLYRGRAAVELAGQGVAFETVVAWLWQASEGELEADAGAAAPRAAAARALACLDVAAARHPPTSRMSLLLAAAALADPGRVAAPRAAELRRARALLDLLAGHALGDVAPPCAPPRIAATCFASAGLGVPAPEQLAALDAALVVCADHELNASTFAARVAASTGADLHACLGAALGALSGPRHGGATLRVEALLDEVERAPDAALAVRDRLLRGEPVAGFGHRLYPGGDPRARPLLEHAARLAPGGVERALALVEAMADAGHPAPTVDFALVVLARALGLPRGGALAVFAVGRSAGWVAHVFEQRQSPSLLRPRARYTGDV